MSHGGNSYKTPMERIREAAHEVQRPVFYAIAIIITAYLPIFTLQRVEDGCFIRWHGRWPLRFSVRWCFPCSSRQFCPACYLERV